MLGVLILIAGIFSRVVFHAPNFTPVISLALFGGVYLNKRQAIYVPMLLMAVTDVILGMHPTMPFTWGSLLLISLLGLWARNRKNVATLFGANLFGAILFFVVTNFGAWLTMYPLTAEGLRNCYIAAIPFFRNTLLSTLVYSTVLFGLYEFIASRIKNTRFAHIFLVA